jgi:predicted Zn-dependent peptidase
MSNLPCERLESPTLREVVYRTVLPSGLGVFFCPKPGFKKKYACYSTHFGSVDNEFLAPSGERQRVPDGIAHFLEHTLFETERGNVSDLFARNGAYSNASTSFTTTTYLFAASDRFFDNLKLLVEFVERPAFDAAKVEKEKGIIEQEIKGYDDNPDWVSYMGLLSNLFRSHPIRIDIAGTPETIRQIDVALLESCYRTFYHPRNMLLFVIGELDGDELFDFVARHSRSAAPGSRPLERLYPDEPPEVTNKETRKEMEVAVPKLLLGFKEVGVPLKGKEYILRSLVSEMALELLLGHSSDTFRELYERQMVLDDFAASYHAGAGIGYAAMGGATPCPDALRETLLERLEKLRRGGPAAEDFEREKRKFIGTFIRGFNSLEYMASNYTYFRFHDFDLFATIDLLEQVTREMLAERMDTLLAPGQSASYVVLPKK